MKSSGLPYHRRITVRQTGAGHLEAHMQDHCHHIRVQLSHEVPTSGSAARITRASAEGIRLPWNACPLGVAGIGRLSGLTVDEALDTRNWPGGRTGNCVHAADLALVALAHVGETDSFRYTITVAPALGRVRRARIHRGGELLLEWTLDGAVLGAPGRWAGRTLRRVDFLSWAADLDPATREAATQLRRACHIAPSRDIDLDTMSVAADSIRPDASCHTLQTGVIETARRVMGSSRAELTDADGPPPG